MEFADKHRKLLVLASRNIFILSCLLLILQNFTSVVVIKYINLAILKTLIIVFGFLWLFFYIKKDEEKYKKAIGPYFKFGFLAGLSLITIASLKFEFIQNIEILGGIISFLSRYSFLLTLVTIGFGAFTFYFNRERAEQEIEEEKVNEEQAEKERKEGFALKFSRISKIPVLNNIVKWMYKEGWGYSLGLIAIIILGFGLRVLIGISTNPDLDEGQLVYDSKLAGDGLIPFRDFTTRAPLLVYSLLFINKLLLGGSYLLSSKILISLIFSITSLGIYLLSKEIFKNKLTGIVTILLVNLAPFYLFYSVALHVAQASIISIVFFCLFFIKFIKTSKKINIFLAGLALGIGYLIRRDLIIYMAFGAIFLFYLNIKNIKRALSETIILTAGFIVGILPLIYLVFKSNLLWMDRFYGLTSLLSQSVGASAIMITTDKWFIFFIFLICNSIFLFPYIRSLIGHVFSKEMSPVIYFLVIAILFFTGISFSGTFKTGGYNIYQSNFYYLALVFGMLYSLFIINLGHSKKRSNENRKIFGFIYFILVFYYLVLFITLQEFHSSYFIATLFIPIMIFSDYIVSNKKKILKNKIYLSFIIGLFILFILILNIDMFNSYKYERSWSNQEINEVNLFLNDLSANKTIFTVGFTLVIDSQRDILFNITHYGVYDEVKCYKNQEFPALKCLDDLGKDLNETNIDYIVGDARTMRLIRGYDKLFIPFDENYVKIKAISPSVEIYGVKKRK
jgi:hypothetical protein